MPPTIEEPKPKTETEKPAVIPAKEEPGAAADSFLKQFYSDSSKKKAPPAVEKPADEKPNKEDKPKEEAKPKADAPKEEKPKETAKPKAKAAPIEPPPTFDADRIAEAVAQGVSTGLSKKAQAEKPKPADVADGLTDDERETYEVLARMDAPTSVKYVQSTKNAKKYQADWESRNAGKKFDPDSPEHNEFFDENTVDWNEVTFNRTLAKMEAEKLFEAERKKGNPELDALRQKDKLRDEEPKILIKKRATAKSFFAALGDDYKDIITEDGRVNMAEVKRLKTADPLRDIVFDAAENVEAFAGELYRLTNGLAEYDEKNKSHELMWDFIQQQEVLLRNMPYEEQLFEGKRFATADEFNAMPPAKRVLYWKLSPDDVTEMYAAHEAKLAQERIVAEEKRIDAINAAREKAKKPSDKAVESNGTEKATDTPEAVVEKPNSPAGTVEPRMALTPVNHGANGESKASSFTRLWLGRS